MLSLSQAKYQRQRIVKYAQKHSVTETAIRYKVSRKVEKRYINGVTDMMGHWPV